MNKAWLHQMFGGLPFPQKTSLKKIFTSIPWEKRLELISSAALAEQMILGILFKSARIHDVAAQMAGHPAHKSLELGKILRCKTVQGSGMEAYRKQSGSLDQANTNGES